MFDAIGEGHKIMHEGVKKMIDLDELERLHAAATPGPWYADDASAFADDEDFEIRTSTAPIAYGISMDDAHYIVAACNALPKLIERVREMDRQMVWLAKQVCDSFSPQEWINRAEQATKEDGE